MDMTAEEIARLCPPRQGLPLSRGRISYREAGSGDALVFLHGLLGGAASWALQFAAFRGRFRVIAWDAPGFGASDPVGTAADTFADVLAEFLDALGAKAPTLVGHSMGGVVAARCAFRHPDRAARLILSCSHAGYGEGEDAPPRPRFLERLAELERLGAAAYGRVRARGLLGDDAPQGLLDFAATIAAEVDAEGMAQANRMLQLADNRSCLPRLRLPRLVIGGERDRVVAPALKAELAALTPGARRVEIPGAGHAPYFEAPAAYNAAIGEFIAETSAS